MLNRRQIILSASLLPVSAWAEAKPDWQLALEAAIATKDPVTLGHRIPLPDDPVWREAHAILDGAPTAASPMKIAEYFVTSVPRKFQMAWPEPNPQSPTDANPVIVLFFLTTKTEPAGDTTPWCAAFANWCLRRAGIDGTRQAGALSFRQWGSPVWERSDGDMPAARPGDIAVFQLRSDPEHGHVAFFKGISAKYAGRIDALGGNQIVGSGANKIHLIDIRPMRVNGDLELVAIRTADGLRT